MVLLAISAAITLFLLITAFILMLGKSELVDERLLEVGAQEGPQQSQKAVLVESDPTGLPGFAKIFLKALKPIRDLIMSNDEDLTYRLTQAGYRKPVHADLYVTAKMLLPVLGLVAATFAGDNMLAVLLVGVMLGFFGPDLYLTHTIRKRIESIRRALPDALDLVVICMEAGLGIDQALVRVGEEVRLTSPALADEFLIITREQRAGKPRLEAWRAMTERVDLDDVRQFVGMLAQTERFGTPIANALGQFSDVLRLRRMQSAEERAAKTTIKLLFPLVLFIFPSLFVVTMGPALLNIMQSFESFGK